MIDTCKEGVLVLLKAIVAMLIATQGDQLGSPRRRLSRKRSIRSSFNTDDRGWTPLHIGSRKGDLKEVFYLISGVLF